MILNLMNTNSVFLMTFFIQNFFDFRGKYFDPV